ncbi:MAG: hypothetical protein L6Q73_09345 [Aquabacterium sp.]|nr:hypothetical protein [Aquabacterium sp.]
MAIHNVNAPTTTPLENPFICYSVLWMGTVLPGKMLMGSARQEEADSTFGSVSTMKLTIRPELSIGLRFLLLHQLLVQSRLNKSCLLEAGPRSDDAAHRRCDEGHMNTTTSDVRELPSATSTYLSVLTWLFTLFNSVRVLAYLPTLVAIFTSGDSSQHSLLTWVTWVGANATMAAWLYEHNGRHLNRAIAVNVCNSMMCLATSILIVAYRL